MLLLLQLVQLLFRDGKLRGGVRGRQGGERGQRGHLAHRRQPDEPHIQIVFQRRHGLFICAVDVNVPAALTQFLQLGGGEVSPFRQLFRGGVGGGLLLLQGFPAVDAFVQLPEERLELTVGQHRRLLLSVGILLQYRRRFGQRSEALRIPLIGVGLFREVDNAQLPQPVQQGGLFRGSGHDVDHLHFLDHRLTSCSFFLAILPRTTAEVC